MRAGHAERPEVAAPEDFLRKEISNFLLFFFSLLPESAGRVLDECLHFDKNSSGGKFAFYNATHNWHRSYHAQES